MVFPASSKWRLRNETHNIFISLLGVTTYPAGSKLQPNLQLYELRITNYEL
ncbi:hypothetical protein FDUTEX481_05311 [Tolypothrix sp. PCC 7601]|nr:hypothetical protein FDUTEX481_05311 [Tolypothrix sp. PCC 7601]